MMIETRSMPRLPLACPLLLLIAAVLVACGESHDDRDAGAGAGSSGSAAGNGGSKAGSGGSGGRSGQDAGNAGASGSGAGGSGGTAGDTGAPPDPDSCMIDTDCGFGEIDHEILKKSDCPCLLGCPYIAENRETITRRRDAYNALCEQGRDGQGRPCAIDDCVQMPDGVCVEETCGGAR